jgi:hypothetical protein
MTGLELLLVILFTVAGALLVSLAGFISSGEKFDLRKFTASAIRTAIAAVATSLTFTFTPPFQPVYLVLAFLAGAGIEVGLKRGQDAIQTMARPPPTE